MEKRVHSTNLMSEVTRYHTLDTAFKSVRKRRLQNSPNSDIWSLSLSWQHIKNTLRETLLSGHYQLSPTQIFKTDHGLVSRFGSQDAVVMKALSMVLAPIIKTFIGHRCYHLAGLGGVKGGVRALMNEIPRYRYLIKSDVASYYDNVNHSMLMIQVKKVVKDRRIHHLIEQYLNRVEILDGEHRLIYRGIPMGCSLSPLMGALALKSLDTVVEKGCAYFRYMDDWVILTKTRSVMRRHVKKMHQVMQMLKFKLAKDKTFIGKISSGFDFLGYRFNESGRIGLALKTIQNFNERYATLYEQGASEKRLSQYVRRWVGWCRV